MLSKEFNRERTGNLKSDDRGLSGNMLCEVDIDSDPAEEALYVDHDDLEDECVDGEEPADAEPLAPVAATIWSINKIWSHYRLRLLHPVIEWLISHVHILP